MTMNRRRIAAVMTTVISILVGLCLASTGVVHAAAQVDQEWFGAVDSNGNGYYLGVESGGSGYVGNIHTFIASDKCLDVPGGSFFTVDQGGNGYAYGGNASGTQVQLWDCEPQDPAHGYDANQQWYQSDNGDGTWGFYVVDGPDVYGNTVYYCLDAGRSNAGTGSPVKVKTCNGTSAQQWTIGPEGQVQSVGSPGACLDAPDFTDSNGVRIVLGPCQYD
jgi:hypothetical protein